MVAHRSNAISQSTIPDELNSLLLYSKELGLDRMQIQAAGGNTSIKVGDTSVSYTHLTLPTICSV